MNRFTWTCLLLLTTACDCSDEVELSPFDGGTGGMDGAVRPDGAVLPDGARPPDAGSPCPGVGEQLCAGACVNTQVDPANCGGCGRACASGQVCLSSGCAGDCPMGLDACAGTCVDTASDSAHCGGCDMPCAMGTGCSAGGCVPTVPLGSPPARCAGGGPPIDIGGDTFGVCTGEVAETTFTHGLCSCDDIGVPVVSSELYVDGYDSSRGPYEPGGGGGHVGANGTMRNSSRVEIFGNLEIAGAEGWIADTTTLIHEELHDAARLEVRAELGVDGDAFVVGPFSGGGAGTVAGTLHTEAACASVPMSLRGGGCVTEEVNVPPPCRCAASELLPIAEIVRFYADPSHNDNAAIGLDPDVLAAPGAPGRLDLPCGYYHLSRIADSGAVTIAVHGRTAIFVSGSIEVGSALAFALDPGSTLDVFVGGTLFATAHLRVGTPAYPRQSRFYVGGVCGGESADCASDADCCSGACESGSCSGSGEPPPWSVNLTSNTDLAGLFYAPYGRFLVTSDLEMYGAIFVGGYDAAALTRIHYDRAAGSAGDDCPPPMPPPPPDGGAGIDAGPRPDAGVPVCGSGAPACGPGLPACATGFFCVVGCCAFFG